MWPIKWLSSSWRERRSKPPSRSRSYGSSSCCSFKDVETLIQPEPQSPKSPSLFHHRLRFSSSPLTRFLSPRTVVPATALPPDSDLGSVVIYYTSLRVVRRTFSDCTAVRSILRRFPVAIDERDLCVDGGRFREELQGIIGRQNVPLPSVFVGGEYIGGADEVRKLYESGELRERIERLPRRTAEREECRRCAGLRFVVCEECDGSHKVFAEKSGAFRSCSDCSPNGLIRCPACFFPPVSRHSK